MFTLSQILHARALYFHAKPRCERGKEGDTSPVDKGAAEATARSPKPSDKLSLGAVKCRRRDRPIRQLFIAMKRFLPPLFADDDATRHCVVAFSLLTAMIAEGEGGREDTLLKAERAR